jgi:hypothetical protein
MQRLVLTLCTVLSLVVTIAASGAAATYGSITLIVPLTVDGILDVPNPSLFCSMTSSPTSNLVDTPIPSGQTRVPPLTQGPNANGYSYHGPAIAVVIANYGNPGFPKTPWAGAVFRCAFNPDLTIYNSVDPPAPGSNANQYVDFTLPSTNSSSPTFTTSPLVIRRVPPSPPPVVTTFTTGRLAIVGAATNSKLPIIEKSFPTRSPTVIRVPTIASGNASLGAATRKTYGFNITLMVQLTVDGLPNVSAPNLSCVILSSPVGKLTGYNFATYVPLTQGPSGYFYHGPALNLSVGSSGVTSALVTGAVIRCTFIASSAFKIAPGSKDYVDFTLP